MQMKKKSKRYYGMTLTQIGILAGAGVVVLLFIGGAFLFILMQTPRAQPVATEIILPTLTPAPISPMMDDTPTLTPAPVIATSVPPGGWLEFKTQGATLWLPANFVGGDLVSNKQETVNKITRLGRFYKNIVNDVKGASQEVVLWMVEKIVKQTDIITTVNITHITGVEDISLDQFIQQYLNGDVGGTPVAMFFTVNETKKMTLLGRETKRLTYSSSYAGPAIIGLVYYIKDGADIWVVNYGLNPNEYVDMLPIVEQSIQTFNLAP